MVVVKIIAVWIMGVAIGVLYRIPRRLVIPSSLVGVLAWLIYYSATISGVNTIFANFIASLAVGFAAELLARQMRKPATMFAVPGFIPLVPGREAYTTMLHMVRGDYLEGVAMGMQTLLIAGAIAFGIFISSTLYRLGNNYRSGIGRSHADGN